MRRVLLLVAFVWLGMAWPDASAGKLRGFLPQAGGKTATCSVRKIYVVELGTDPRYVNFRLDLQKWLAKKKFTVVERREEADGVLTGTLLISSGTKRSRLAFTHAELKTASGEHVWRGDFDRTTKNAFGWLGRGHIENGAKLIAEIIRAECR